MWPRPGGAFPRAPLALGLALVSLGAAPLPDRKAALEEAAALIQRSENVKARALCERIVAEAARAGDWQSEGTAHLHLADTHFYQNDLPGYGREAQRAYEIFERGGDDSGVARSLYSLAYMFERTQPARMLPLLERAQARALKAGDQRTLMKIHNAFGTAAWGLGRFALALQHYGQAAEIAEREKQENNLAVALSNMGGLEIVRGNPEAGLPLIERALPLFEHQRNQRSLANALGKASQAWETLGDLEKSQRLGEQALAIFRSLDFQRGVATQLSALGEQARRLGDGPRAERLLLEGLALATKLDDTQRSVGLLVDLGQLLVDQRQPERAEPHLRTAIARAEQLGDPRLVALATLTLASVADARGDHAAALALAERARERSASIGDLLGEGYAWALQAEQLELLQRPREALHALERALALHRQAHARPELPSWEARLARLLAKLGDDASAQRHFEQALLDVEALNHLIALDRYRFSLFRNVAAVYRGYAAWLAERGQAPHAWEVVELGRARDLQWRLARAGASVALAPAERDALALVSELQRELGETSARARRQELQAQLAEAEAAYDTARRDSLAATLPAAAPAAAQVAPPLDDLVVEYARAGDALLVFARRAGHVSVRTVAPLGPLLERVARLRAATSDASVPFAAGADARALFESLLGPETEGLPGGALTLVPDETLVALPFAALQLRDGAWLAERFTLAQAPSLAVLDEQRHRAQAQAQARGSVLAVASTGSGGLAQARGAAERLAAASDEARGAAQRAGSSVLLDPLEGQLKSADFGAYDVLHFAGHASIDELRPERSALVLGAGGGEDGLLQAREIYRLRMPLRLVVVSSCRSGTGGALMGEGLLGLSHALYAAGARALVTTLWDVSDEGSAEAMRRFYAALETHSLADALSLTQRGMMHSSRFSHPAHWAGYVAAGDAAQLGLVAPRGRRRVAVAIACAGLALLALLAYRVRRARAARSA